MGFLYINSRGEPWRKHSYSAGNTFTQSAQKYYLQKILGWREKDKKARFLFGRALEESIEWFHDHGGETELSVQDFQRRWTVHKDNKELTYTKVEKDWETLNLDGMDMIRLYAIRQPSLPIPLGGRSVFQRQYSKEVFPGSDENFNEIQDVGKIDIVSYADPKHPLLPQLEWKSEYGPYLPIIVDIKTAGQNFPDVPGIARFDKQLRRYSWLSGIRVAALLWFTKAGRSLRKGSSVTLLVKRGYLEAGQEAVIAKVDDETLWLVANDHMIEVMEDAQGKKADGSTDQTKVAKEKRDQWLQVNAVQVKSEDVTRQRLQFNCGYITQESAEEAGEIAGQQIIGIVQAWKKLEKTGKPHLAYPQNMGIRYPSDDSSDPYFQAFVSGDTNFRDQNFTKTDEQSLDDLFQEEDQEVEA